MRFLPVLLLAAACSPQMMMVTDAGGNCGTTLSPANLVDDGSFECKDGAAWSGQFGDFAVVMDARTGTKAARVTAGSSGAGQFGAGPLVSNTTGKAYCAAAWVKGTAANARMEVLAQNAGMAQAFSSPVSSEWIRMPPSKYLRVLVGEGDKLYLRFVILGGTAGQTLIVDDVDLYESASDNCTERN